MLKLIALPLVLYTPKASDFGDCPPCPVCPDGGACCAAAK
jgi:hypothetical protein